MEENQPASSKVKSVLFSLLKCCLFLAILWGFICSLDLLGASFCILWGKQAGKVFQNNKLLQNPVVGLMIGVLSTVLVQSSSTSTSIVITMVGTKLMTVRDAIPIVMGTNIGTSVTNTLVSLGQVADKEDFRRAFAAATIHDMFNWLAVIVLLPIEFTFGYLEALTEAIMATRKWSHAEGVQNLALLHTFTRPVTNRLVQLDMKLLEDIATGIINETDAPSILKRCFKNGTEIPCGYLLEMIPWSDSALGLLLLFFSLVLLCFCLLTIIKILNSALGGQLAKLSYRLINAEPRFPYNHILGYMAIALGCVITVLVQSSSVFTSTLTPLAGVGLVSLKRMYPLTLGANIGTTTTGLLAAFAAPPSSIHNTLQLAFCHLFFNLSGILLFYPIPFMRLPIPLAKMLGSVTSKYKWFAIFYLTAMFIVIPVIVFCLSIVSPVALAIVGGSILIIVVVITVINILQCKKPSILPSKLRDWSFLPLWMHSLEPMDKCISSISCCKRQQEERVVPAQ